MTYYYSFKSGEEERRKAVEEALDVQDLDQGQTHFRQTIIISTDQL